MSDFGDLEIPKQVIHTLCGEPIFIYFGSHEDAQQLRNFNEIGTLEGDAILPEHIIACVHCGERIRIDQLQVVSHETKEIHVFQADEYVKLKKIMDEELAKQLAKHEELAKRKAEAEYHKYRREEIEKIEKQNTYNKLFDDFFKKKYK